MNDDQDGNGRDQSGLSSILTVWPANERGSVVTIILVIIIMIIILLLVLIIMSRWTGQAARQAGRAPWRQLWEHQELLGLPDLCQQHLEGLASLYSNGVTATANNISSAWKICTTGHSFYAFTSRRTFHQPCKVTHLITMVVSEFYILSLSGWTLASTLEIRRLQRSPHFYYWEDGWYKW